MKRPALTDIIASLKEEPFSKEKRQAILLIVLLVVGGLYPFVFPQFASASTPAEVLYRPDRMTAGTAAAGGVSGAVCVKPSGAVTESTVTIVFPSGWTLDATTSNWTLDTTATNIPTESGFVQWPTTTSGNATSVNNGTHTVVFTVGDITGTTSMNCFHFTATGSTTTSVTGDNQTGSIATDGDTTARTYATSQTTNDQLSVTATVNQIFSFSLSSGTHSLVLTPGGATVSSGTASNGSIGTNAPNGYYAWVKSANAALHSTILGSGSDITAGSFASGSNIVDLASTTGYVLDCQDTSGTGCATGVDFNGNGSTSGGKLPTTFKALAKKTSATAADTFTLKVRAKVGATQAPATDYADTITVDAAGQF